MHTVIAFRSVDVKLKCPSWQEKQKLRDITVFSTSEIYQVLNIGKILRGSNKRLLSYLWCLLLKTTRQRLLLSMVLYNWHFIPTPGRVVVAKGTTNRDHNKQTNRTIQLKDIKWKAFIHVKLTYSCLMLELRPHFDIFSYGFQVIVCVCVCC